ncbi:unnamed protein product [Periconia digitata]|uniref:Amidase domain-containing protein n=1 Tax=Periconia digitata TaxID=1303443 RepID=A0A9W4U904_9PLEO|nr:unnamed protein product [Periconia digitata]
MLAILLKTWVASVVLFSSTNALPSSYTGLPSLLDATAEELALGLENNHFSSVDLVNAYTKRILEVNDTLHVVTEINPDAWKIASELDEERAAGNSRGPLHGLPVLLKNNIATDDLMNNTDGSYALLGAKVPRDATVVAKLRKAGAIILGKANLSQWTNFRSSNSSNGWSSHGGQVYGAYYPGQDPWGSSSGSSVASSLGLAVATLGTETDGSIILPSHQNNVVGIKPTVGLTSRAQVIPVSEHLDTIGPIARTVKDAAYILQAMAGTDQYDNYTSAIPNNGTLPDYVAACTLDALKGKRIGVPRNYIGARTETTAPILDAFESALQILTDAGATIVDNTNYTAYDQFITSGAEIAIVGTDFKANLASYLSSLTVNPNNLTTLADIRAFTQSFPLDEYPDRDTATWDLVLSLNLTTSSPGYWAAHEEAQFLGGPGGILGALESYNLDAVVTPSYISAGISAIIGAPVISVPLGAYPEDTTVRTNPRGDLNLTAPNVPFGISFSAGLWSEVDLIGFAYAFEQRTKVREMVKPVVKPSTELWDVGRK